MSETRKLTTIVAADVAGYSRLAAADEERTVMRLRALRGDLIDPAITAHHGRIVKRTGDGTLMEFRSVVDAVRCAIEVQNGMVERNAGLPFERQILFRVGIHLGDVIEENDGDLMGDGVNIAARLENICEPGAICLSEDAYRQVKSRLDLAVSDLGDKSLKNIPEPVHVFSLEVGKPAQAKPAGPIAPIVPPPLKKRSMLVPTLIGIAVIGVIVAVGTWYFLGGSKPAVMVANAPAHLSIVVLPFANLSNDPSQDYFADGITENLTTDLSRIRNSFVIARNTAFTYKGKSIDAKEIGKELDVRYVLEGSVQRDANLVRVNAQLIDAESGSHLWADRFEEDIADLFKLQDEIVARLANTLGYELVRAEAERKAHSGNPDAIDLTMRGWALLWQPPAKERVEIARGFFEQALKLDPQNAEALVGKASVDVRAYSSGWTANLVDAAAEAMDLLTKATAINPNYAYAYYLKSTMLFLMKQPQEALKAAQNGLTVNPNSAPVYFAMGQAEFPLGLCEQAIAHIQKAFQLSPRDPNIGLWHMNIGNAEFCLGHDDAAIEEYNHAIDAGFRPWMPYTWLAAANARKGNDAEAQAALAEAKRLIPEMTVKWVIARTPNLPAYYDALRKAGLPEDDAPRLSIVVLPFANLSNDPSQDYFADGITENLTTDLSRIRDSFVIARNTAFTYKGKNIDAKEIGKELDVRYVLEGSVQRDGNRVRVNAQLIDAESGTHLWADRFEEDIADLFKLQDEIVARLANTLGYELVKAEAGKSAQSRDPNATDLTMRGWALIWQPPNKERCESARGLFEQALKLDPQNAEALAGIAYTDVRAYAFGWTADLADTAAEAMDLLAKATAINPNYAYTYWLKSTMLFLTKQMPEALQAAQTGLTINPNSAPAYFAMGQAEFPLGLCQQAIAHIKEAFKLSPRDPSIGLWHMNIGNAEFCLGHDDAAIEEENQAIAAGFRPWVPYTWLAAAYTRKGNEAEAKAALAEAKRVVPEISVKWVSARSPNVPAYFDALRKAGLPEE
jgi:adenylate cyclase